MTSQSALVPFVKVEVVSPLPSVQAPVPADLAAAIRELAMSFEKIEFGLRRLMALR